MARMIGAVGFVALLLSAIGLYGTLALAVTRRAREIGIRAALGARVADVVRLVVGQASRLVALGLLIGTATALWASRFLRDFLYDTEPNDPTIFGGVVLLLAVVASAASFLPARRAAAVDPATVLRGD